MVLPLPCTEGPWIRSRRYQGSRQASGRRQPACTRAPRSVRERARGPALQQGRARLGGVRPSASRRACLAASTWSCSSRRCRPSCGETAAAGVPVIVLAERAEPADAFAAAQLGADALLDQELLPCRAHRCYKEASPAARRQPLRHALTPRQTQVLELIVEGLDNSQIAARLGDLGADRARPRVRACSSASASRTAPRPPSRRSSAGWLATLAGAPGAAGPAPPGAAACGRALRRGCGPRSTQQMRSAGGGVRRLGRRRIRARRLRVEGRREPRVPASVQKLVTTATALDRLGPEARFETAVLASGTIADGSA